MGAQLSSKKKYHPVLPEHYNDSKDIIMVHFGSEMEELPSPYTIVNTIALSAEDRQIVTDFRINISRCFENMDFSVAFVKLPYVSIAQLDDVVLKLQSNMENVCDCTCIVLNPDELITLDAKALLHVRKKAIQMMQKNVGLCFLVQNPIISAYFGDVCVCGWVRSFSSAPLASAVSYPVIANSFDLANKCNDQHAFAGINSDGHASIFLSKGNPRAFVVSNELMVHDVNEIFSLKIENHAFITVSF